MLHVFGIKRGSAGPGGDCEDQRVEILQFVALGESNSFEKVFASCCRNLATGNDALDDFIGLSPSRRKFARYDSKKFTQNLNRNNVRSILCCKYQALCQKKLAFVCWVYGPDQDVGIECNQDCRLVRSS